MSIFKMVDIPNKGRGLLATKDIPSGTLIERSPAIKMDARDSYILQDTGLVDYIFNRDCNDLDDDRVSVVLGYGSIMNHASEGYDNIDYEPDPNDGGLHFLYIANRDIKSGEELLIDYGWSDPSFNYSYDRKPNLVDRATTRLGIVK